MTYLECQYQNKRVVCQPIFMRFHKYKGQQGVVLRESKNGMLLIQFDSFKNPVSIPPSALKIIEENA